MGRRVAIAFFENDYWSGVVELLLNFVALPWVLMRYEVYQYKRDLGFELADRSVICEETWHIFGWFWEHQRSRSCGWDI